MVATTTSSCRAKSCTAPAHPVPGELQRSSVTQRDCCPCQLCGVCPPLARAEGGHKTQTAPEPTPAKNWKHHRVGGHGQDDQDGPAAIPSDERPVGDLPPGHPAWAATEPPDRRPIDRLCHLQQPTGNTETKQSSSCSFMA